MLNPILHSRKYFLFILLSISSLTFGQNVKMVSDSLQNQWELCKYMTNPDYFDSNDGSRLSCIYHIKFEENKFMLVKDLEKIDTGDFEIKYNDDDTFLIKFYSEFSNEILKLLESDTIKIIDKKESGFTLMTESPVNLFVLLKT